MTLESAPPPNYSQGDSDNSQVVGSVTPQDPQILIIPTVDTINFQKGFLGADGERAAIEGELQIKETTGGRWAKMFVNLLHLKTLELRRPILKNCFLTYRRTGVYSGN
jgi:neural Wiskott-Aldrich syndrome protein